MADISDSMERLKVEYCTCYKTLTAIYKRDGLEMLLRSVSMELALKTIAIQNTSNTKDKLSNTTS